MKFVTMAISERRSGTKRDGILSELLESNHCPQHPSYHSVFVTEVAGPAAGADVGAAAEAGVGAEAEESAGT